jgi:hypothetical protein
MWKCGCPTAKYFFKSRNGGKLSRFGGQGKTWGEIGQFLTIRGFESQIFKPVLEKTKSNRAMAALHRPDWIYFQVQTTF